MERPLGQLNVSLAGNLSAFQPKVQLAQRLFQGHDIELWAKFSEEISNVPT